MTIAPPGPGRMSATTPTTATGLPRPIRSVLEGVDRRLRAAGAMRGLGTLLVTSASIAAGAMLIDFLRPLPGPARWAIWLAWISMSAAMLGRSALGPALRRHRPDELAAVAGRTRPDRGQVLTAAVSLAGLGDQAHGSPELIAALIDRASEEAGAIRPSRAVPLAGPRRRLAVGLVALGVVALPAILSPEPFAALAWRFLSPWADPGSAGLLAIAVEPGDAVVLLGTPVTISAEVRPRATIAGSPPDSALLSWTDPKGVSHTLEMGPGGDSQEDDPSIDHSRSFALTLPPVDGPISYRVLSGMASSRAYRIEAVEPIGVASHRWTIAPPPYTGRDAETIDDPTTASAWQDSRVTIVASTDRPARVVSLRWPTEDGSTTGQDDATIAFESPDDGRTWAVEVSATASGPFEILAEDGHGLIGLPGPSGRLRVLPDAPPVVALAELDDASGPGGRLLIPVASRDDVALSSAELHVAILRSDAEPGSPPEPLDGPIPLTLDGLGSPSARGVAELDLAPLNLGDGDTLSVRVRVRDNRPAPRGPNEGWSEPRPVAIVADVQQYDADRLDAQLRPIREELEALARLAAENHRGLPPIRSAAEAARRDDEAWTDRRAADLDRLAESARELVDRLQLLSGALEVDPSLSALADPVRQAAEAEADDARDALDDARRDEDDPDARLDDLRRAEADLDASSRRLDDLNRQLNSLARAAAARPELANLADREEQLAEQAEALADASSPPPDAPDAEANPEAEADADADADPGTPPPIDPEALRQLREAQEQLSRALADLMRRAPALRDDADASRARADAESARRELDRADPEASPGDPSESSSSARSAAEAMRRAAEQLRRASGPADPSSRAEQLSRLLADQAADPSSSSDSSDPGAGDPSAAPSGSAAAGPSEPAADLSLRAERSWGGLPGHLRTELLQSSPDRYRDDYAALIRLYFREIARGASAPLAPPAESP